jgi:hypothetical protein
MVPPGARRPAHGQSAVLRAVQRVQEYVDGPVDDFVDSPGDVIRVRVDVFDVVVSEEEGTTVPVHGFGGVHGGLRRSIHQVMWSR